VCHSKLRNRCFWSPFSAMRNHWFSSSRNNTYRRQSRGPFLIPPMSSILHPYQIFRWVLTCRPVGALHRKSHLCIPFLGIARPQPQFPHSCVCERFIYIVPGSVYTFPPAEQADRSWEYINLSQTTECGNWD
jgi:hypothetical protein